MSEQEESVQQSAAQEIVEERYNHDPDFRSLVDFLYEILKVQNMPVTDLVEAATLASILFLYGKKKK